MTDPRFTGRRPDPDDPNDPNARDPFPSRTDLSSDNGAGLWGWVAGLAAAALIAVIIVAAWSGRYTSTADMNPGTSRAPVMTGSAPVRHATPPSTTGSAAGSAMPPDSRPVPQPKSQPMSPPAPDNGATSR
jgi:hypothetical protein